MAGNAMGEWMRYTLTAAVSALGALVVITLAFSDARHLAQTAYETAKRAESAANTATGELNKINVRLERIQTTLEQILTQHAERIAKIETWRDGPHAPPR